VNGGTNFCSENVGEKVGRPTPADGFADEAEVEAEKESEGEEDETDSEEFGDVDDDLEEGKETVLGFVELTEDPAIGRFDESVCCFMYTSQNISHHS